MLQSWRAENRIEPDKARRRNRAVRHASERLDKLPSEPEVGSAVSTCSITRNTYVTCALMLRDRSSLVTVFIVSIAGDYLICLSRSWRHSYAVDSTQPVLTKRNVVVDNLSG